MLVLVRPFKFSVKTAKDRPAVWVISFEPAAIRFRLAHYADCAYLVVAAPPDVIAGAGLEAVDVEDAGALGVDH